MVRQCTGQGGFHEVDFCSQCIDTVICLTRRVFELQVSAPAGPGYYQFCCSPAGTITAVADGMSTYMVVRMSQRIRISKSDEYKPHTKFGKEHSVRCATLRVASSFILQMENCIIDYSNSHHSRPIAVL